MCKTKFKIEITTSLMKQHNGSSSQHYCNLLSSLICMSDLRNNNNRISTGIHMNKLKRVCIYTHVPTDDPLFLSFLSFYGNILFIRVFRLYFTYLNCCMHIYNPIGEFTKSRNFSISAHRN